LSNGGEQVILLGPAGETIQTFTYSDDPPWPTSPDGNGYSLEIINPLGDPSSPANWRASALLGGSPGTDGLPTGTPGDFNNDERVDGNDFLAWQRGVGIASPNATRADGDADGDKDVDRADFLKWAENYGETPMVAAVVVAEAMGATIVTAHASPAPAVGAWRDDAWVLWDQWAAQASGDKPLRGRPSRRALLAANLF
jgi:hypothetical protein